MLLGAVGSVRLLWAWFDWFWKGEVILFQFLTDHPVFVSSVGYFSNMYNVFRVYRTCLSCMGLFSDIDKS